METYRNDFVLRPRYEETDQMGVVYHGNYYRYFEVGRTEYFRSLGYSYRKLEDEGITLPVVECSCKYIKPAKYDEELIIRTEIGYCKGVRLEFDYTVILKHTGEILSRGKSLHAFVNHNMKPVRIRDLNPKFLEVLKSVVSV